MRRRLFVRTALMIGLAATAALACSPTTPCDPRASSGFNVLQFSCDPAGSDAQCQAMAENDNLYTCGPTSADVTSTATFISSDPSVAVFGAPGRAPGYLTTVGSGTVSVTAQYSNLPVISAVRLFLTPGAPADRLADLTVNVLDARTSTKIPSALVVVTSDAGPQQTCVTDQFGRCDIYVRHGSMVIAATAAGYQPGQITFLPGPTQTFASVTLSL